MERREEAESLSHPMTSSSLTTMYEFQGAAVFVSDQTPVYLLHISGRYFIWISLAVGERTRR
jgi:hypothetical protein